MSTRRLVLGALALYASLDVASQAAVTVEPSSLIIDQSTNVLAGAYSHYSLRLRAGAELTVDLTVQGGLSNTLTVWLLDLPDFQRFEKRQEFTYFKGTSGRIASSARYHFTVPSTSVYYLVLDNREAILAARTVHVTVYATAEGETEESNRTKQLYERLYEKYLKALFVFKDFDIHVVLCGTENAFSTPDIVLCRELDDALSRKRVPGTMIFVFLHEAAHSLLRLWDFPLYDNEDAADELATVLLLLVDQEDLALQAAEYWAQDGSEVDTIRKLYVDDRHAISPQRARNIIGWINKEQEITGRWFRLLVPKLTDQVLIAMSKDPADPGLKTLALRELASRGVPAE